VEPQARARRTSFARTLTVAVVLLAMAGAEQARGATRFDPALRYQQLRTEHFRIYFHQRSDLLAARLAVIAEEGWHALQRPFGAKLPSLTHIVLADQTELSNAYATPLPYDTIVIYLAAPTGAEFDTDDWLRLVFTHEFTHIIHLDRSESWARVVRNIFGRTPIVFPNLFLPTWQIEGLATYSESVMTGEGRLHAGDFRAIVDVAARAGTLEPMDRVNGGLTDWPSGQGAYAYGARFHQYLADRFGIQTLAELADATARRVPYTAAPVFRNVFGESLGSLWADFESTLTADAAANAPDDEAKRLTWSGFVANGPKFEPPACDTCASAIIYAERNPHDFPSLNRVDLDDGSATELTTRFYGSTTAVGTAALYFDQLELRRNINLSGDLYARSRATGRVQRLTSGARLHDPDLSPDGKTLAAVQDHTGGRDLVLVTLNGNDRVDLSAIRVLIAEPGTNFNAPRWSPDGRRLAVERHRLNERPEVIVVDAESGGVQSVVAVTRSRVVMPTWEPDGTHVIAAVAPDDLPFNLVEFDVAQAAPIRQLTHTTGGATWPEISKDGRTLVFVGYTDGGYDVFSMNLASTTRTDEIIRPAPHEEPAVAVPAVPLPSSPTAASPYSPLRTLYPTSWWPVIQWDADQLRLGAATSGIDVLGYHQWSASATWLARAPSLAPVPDRSVPDWSVSYAYDRWRPTFFVTASAQTSFFSGPATSVGTPSLSTDRAQEVEGGILVPFLRVRSSHEAIASVIRAVDDYTFADGRTSSLDRGAVRLAWASNTSRTYGYSISPEDGITVGATVEANREFLGATADATASTLDVRAFLPGVKQHHILAVRAAGGMSTGDPNVGRTFVLGGATGDPSVVDFGSGSISLLRGFPSNSYAGSHVALANLEYRLPLARPQRGAGTLPIFIHTLHASAFADVGEAWSTTFDSHDVKTSFGGELSANIVAGFYYPFTATVGAAYGHDPSGIRPNGTIFYVRIGPAF
jgi:hypothetical protein